MPSRQVAILDRDVILAAPEAVPVPFTNPIQVIAGQTYRFLLLISGELGSFTAYFPCADGGHPTLSNGTNEISIGVQPGPSWILNSFNPAGDGIQVYNQGGDARPMRFIAFGSFKAEESGQLDLLAKLDGSDPAAIHAGSALTVWQD